MYADGPSTVKVGGSVVSQNSEVPPASVYCT